MSNYDLEQQQMDAMNSDLGWALTLQTVGWVLLLFNAIPVTLVWVSFRAGTYFWLYWTIIEGVIGFALVMFGAYLKASAGRHMSRLRFERQGKEAA